ncbi:MAG: hypothetical protein OEY94_00625 [Alphaproteobacteria bacterium]|nr:hypothetical protein [Alphaproteobacteria bacterium]
MNSRIRALVFSFLMVVFAFPEQGLAGNSVNSNIVSPCGKATEGEVPLVGGYCDIYQRQIDYMLNSMRFTKSMEARREAYSKPQWEAIERYRVNLAKSYEEIANKEDKEKAQKKRDMERETRREEMKKKREADREARMKEREAEREARRKEREAEAEKRKNNNKEDKETMPEDEDESASLKEASEEKTASSKGNATTIEPAGEEEETEEKMADAADAMGVQEKEIPASVDDSGEEKNRKVIMPEDAPEFDSNPFE